mgnify:CR=1 FL=1
MANIYYEGEPLRVIKSWEKYYKITAVAFAGLSLYLTLTKSKKDKHELIQATTGLLSTLPIDTNSTDFMSKLLSLPTPAPQTNRMMKSGGSSKRSVSETKKKFVAANQNWQCGECGSQLSAWFEVDHITRLQHGGTNKIDNLVALCRECHGKKTALETMEM